MNNFKSDFEIFDHLPNLVYLDSAASSLKPRSVVEKITDYYTKFSANIHRGMYGISEVATDEYENARKKIANFLKVDSEEIIFCSGSTQAANMIALNFLNTSKSEKIIATSIFEHNSNYLPILNWIKNSNSQIFNLSLNETKSEYDFEQIQKQLESMTQSIYALWISTDSNVIGASLNYNKLISMVKNHNPHCIIILDLSQTIGHRKIDRSTTYFDIAYFSGHKVFAETGIGIIAVNKDILEKSTQSIIGGGIVKSIKGKNFVLKSGNGSAYEAGTPHISGAISLGAAIDYINIIGIDEIEKYVSDYSNLLRNKLNLIENLEIIGPKEDNKSSIISFNISSIHPHDLAYGLNKFDIAARAGKHCAHELFNSLDIKSGSIRFSSHIYNQIDEIPYIIESLEKIIKIFKK